MFKQPTHTLKEYVCIGGMKVFYILMQCLFLCRPRPTQMPTDDTENIYSTGCAETNKGKHISIYALNVGQSNKDHIMLAWLKMLFLLVSVFYCRIVSSLQNYRKIYFGYYHSSCKEEPDNVSGVQIYGHILWHCLYCLGRL